ncbi:MAG: hypothetical protein D4R38_02415 [Dehalococcoidia bacterium]|nr:MAG: hypothetical protein D4R38_02415 [Dehalococcoidia bacterium]
MKIKLVAGFAVVVIFGLCSYSAALLFSVPPPAPAANPEVLFFKADKSKIENGTAATLRWVVDGVDSVVIDHGVGQVAASGSIDVRPSEITAYNLTAFSRGGTVVSSVIINVVPVVKTASVPASPAVNPGVIPSGVPSNMLPSLKEDESYVFYQGAVMVGADDHYIVLRNNPAARNPSWAELKAFLQSDQTDRRAYVTGKFTCGDFAELLHNNAEAAGIRAAIVAVELRPAGMAEGTTNHSLNAFETTDKGLMYIDTTSSAQGYYADKVVLVEVGQEYEPVSIFPQPGQMQTWPSMGRLVAIDIPPLW